MNGTCVAEGGCDDAAALHTTAPTPPFDGIMCDVCTTDFAVKKMYHKRAETIRNVFLSFPLSRSETPWDLTNISSVP